MSSATGAPTLRMPADVGRFTVAKSFEVTARAITAFAGGVDDFNPAYFEDDRPDGLIAHPGMVFSWQWNSRFMPDVELDLAVVRRGVHAAVDVRFERHAREGDVITAQGRSTAIRQTRAGVFSSQRYEFRDSQGELVATMDSDGITRGAELDGEDIALASAPPLPTASAESVAPVWSVTFPIAPQAPHVYTECADIWNPIHTERRVALAAGLPDIILHGSANITLALREVINRNLGGDPTRLVRFAGQFRGMVIPGTEVSVVATEVRDEGGREIIFYEMRNDQGQLAIANGVVVADRPR